MSIPVRYCALVKAADDEKAFKRLHPTMKANMDGGHWSIWACPHDPPCRSLTNVEMVDLMERFMRPVEEIRES